MNHSLCRCLLLTLCVACLCACIEEGDTLFKNEANFFCILDEANHPVREANEALFVLVNFACLAGDKISASCTTSVDGDTITLESEAGMTLEEFTGENPGVCIPLEARCDLGPLAEGTYTVVHGKTTEILTIPAEVEDPRCQRALGEF